VVFSCKILNLEQDGRGGSFMVVIHATLVACKLYFSFPSSWLGWCCPCPLSSSKGTYPFLPLRIKVSVVEFMLLFVSWWWAKLLWVAEQYRGRIECRLMKLCTDKQANVFMDASFDAIKWDIILFQVKLCSLQSKIVAKKTTLFAAEHVGLITAQQCEASLQVLQFLCISRAFKDNVWLTQDFKVQKLAG
jgi:hypothetical protein